MTKLTRIEEVKKILGEYIDYETWLSEKSAIGGWKGDAAERVCQLFSQPLDDKEFDEAIAEVLRKNMGVRVADTIHGKEKEYFFPDMVAQFRALLQPKIEEAKGEVIDMLKNYGVSITNEGVLVPYSDEWDYLHDTPRRTLLRGNDKGESCKKFWQTFS